MMWIGTKAEWLAEGFPLTVWDERTGVQRGRYFSQDEWWDLSQDERQEARKGIVVLGPDTPKAPDGCLRVWGEKS